MSKMRKTIQRKQQILRRLRCQTYKEDVTRSHYFFNFIYYEVQSFIIEINLCGCFIYGFER